MSAEADQLRAELERARAQARRLRADAEHARRRLEKLEAELGATRATVDTLQAELGVARAEAERARRESPAPDPEESQAPETEGSPAPEPEASPAPETEGSPAPGSRSVERTSGRPKVPVWADPRPIDLNTADLGELLLLPGIGRRRAERILRARESRGGFRSVDDLFAIDEIPHDRLARIRAYVFVG